jgi:hypothetical protein
MDAVDDVLLRASTLPNYIRNMIKSTVFHKVHVIDDKRLNRSMRTYLSGVFASYNDNIRVVGTWYDRLQTRCLYI